MLRKRLVGLPPNQRRVEDIPRGLAALLAGRAEPEEGTVVVVSGGNVDPALHARIIANAA